jgi:DNA-binding transcriptional regulator YhcF (GntR family)
MNEFQSGLLNELVAVKITTKEEFEKVINFLSINNCFLVNGEPVVKLTYPGDKAFVILKQDNAIFWQPANQVLDERYKVVNVIEFFRPAEEKVVEAKAEVIEEHVDIDEKHLSLEVQKRPANEAIVSNIDEIVKLIPAIEAKKGVVVDEKNYKDFVKAKTGMVPLYRSYAKKLENERKTVKKAYIEPYQEFEAKVNKVVKALNDTASVVAENVDVFIQKQKEALRKERQAAIDQLKEVLISRKMISKKYADQFVFDEKWLNASTSKKKFEEQVEAQFNALMEKEKNDKLNLEMIEKTITNACLIANVDEKLISREKYQNLLNTEGLPKVTEMITDEVDNIKKQSQAVAQQKEAELQHQKEEFEKKQKEAEIQHQKELEEAKKQAIHSAKEAVQPKYTPIKRGDETIANVNDKYIVTEIKETDPKFKGRTWKKTFEFEGDLAALQMLNRYMDVIKSINPTFNFGEVKLTEKELSDPQTGVVNKYNVKEIN